MALKSIYEIDVDDAKFKAFQTLFDNHQAQVAKMPVYWRAANGELRQRNSLEEANAEWAKETQEAYEKIARFNGQSTGEIERQARFWGTIARETKSTAAEVAGMTQSLLKWTGVATLFTGLLGGGSLWGFTHLAGSVAALRQAGAGIGVNPGQASSFGINFGRFVGDPQGMLARVAAALTDPTSAAYRPIAALLGNPQGNAADVSTQLLQSLPRLFPGGANDRTLGTVAQAYGLTDILSIEDIKRYLSASPAERAQQEQAYRGDAGRLGLDPQTQRAYQDFTTQLDRAGSLIFRVFVRGLDPLVEGGEGGPLGRLSNAATKLVETFVRAVSDRDWVGQLAKGLDDVSHKISDPQFGQSVADFVEGVDKIGPAIKWLASWIPAGDHAADILGPKQDRDAAAAAIGFAGRFFSSEPMSLNDILHGKSTDQQGLLGLVRKLEGSGDQAISPAGAIGRYQIMPGTARSYGRDPSRLFDPTYNEDTARIILSDLVRKYQGNLDEVLAAYNAGPGKANAFRAADDNPALLPGETQRYLSRAHQITGATRIEISKATGADVNVSIQQLATAAAAFSNGL